MDAKPPTLTVIYSPKALKELDENWDWNVEHNGIDQARAYRQFLKGHIDALSTNYNDGRTVSTRPDLRFITMGGRKPPIVTSPFTRSIWRRERSPSPMFFTPAKIGNKPSRKKSAADDRGKQQARKAIISG